MATGGGSERQPCAIVGKCGRFGLPGSLPTLRATLEAKLGPLAEYWVAENVVQLVPM